MNIDGISRIKTQNPNLKPKQKVIVRVLQNIPKVPFVYTSNKTFPPHSFWLPFPKLRTPVRAFWRKAHVLHTRVPVVLTVLFVFLAFTFGMWVSLNTPRSVADTSTQFVADESSIPENGGSFVASFGNAPAGSAPSKITQDVLFNTPIEYLQSYFESPATPDLAAIRTEKLVQYLKQRGSPFARQADVIAKQDHWKLILAISFAESTLGKKCYYNNCSGIGGSNIKSYDSVKSWIEDFNKLLEKRYKNKTLEQMCGVYVQPCNPNWLLATKEILQDIKGMGIE